MSTELTDNLNNRMDGAITSFNHDLQGLRTGRANTALLEGITIDAYGSKMPLDQVATINVAEARLLTVQVWDQANVAAVEKGIATANLGLNPSSDGTLVRVPIPDLSEERRKEMVKILHQYAEKSRIAIRNIRRDGMETSKKMEKDGEISKDEQHDLANIIQEITDEHIKQIDNLLAKKETDIMEV